MGSVSPSAAGKVVVVVVDSLEAEQVRPEAVPYGEELARRTGSSLAVLLLLHEAASPSGSSRSPDQAERVAEALAAELFGSALGPGLPVATALRLGDPSSELMKFLASLSTVTAIVWGGQELPVRERNHWLARIRDRLGVPVVIPSLRQTPGTPWNDAPSGVPDKERP